MQTSKNILGISAFYHDSAAALVQNGIVTAAVHEERFTRKKHDAAFPKNAIKYCLQYSGLELAELDAIVFYDKPLLKFERLLETYYSFAPRGLRSFITAMPIWTKEKMFLKKILRDELNTIGDFNKKSTPLLFPEHHLSHAASAFYPSPYQEAAILTIDGVGEWATASIAHGKGKQISVLKELHFPHSLGLLYSAFTYFLGFRVNNGEYKLMGLAPYGNAQSRAVASYLQKIKNTLVDLKEDGSLWLNQQYFNYAAGLTMVPHKKWEKLFGFAKRNEDSALEQQHCNLAIAVQLFTEEVVQKMAAEAKRLTNAQYLCLAGGVALNCVANGKLLHSGLFKNIYIQPAAGDAGGSLGAALSAHHIYFNEERYIDKQGNDAMSGAYLGPAYSDLTIEQTARKFKQNFQYFNNEAELLQMTAKLIAEGNAIGWFQGRMEYGPRALGSRSILGDARNEEMQRKLNLKIKYRESFRPFAPSVLAEDCQTYFDLATNSPYMLLVAKVKSERRNVLPNNYHDLPIKEKLYYKRSDIPAVTHIDFTARVQTVHRATNPKYWRLLQAFKQLTGYSLVVNTSFNVRGEPIVNSPADALNCFLNTEMDYLVMNNYLFTKEKILDS